MKKYLSLSVIAITTITLLPTRLPVAAQYPAPNPGIRMQSLDTRLEATERFMPQFQLNQINLDFKANLTLGANASIDPLADDLTASFPSDPCLTIFIPAGCFNEGANGFRVTNPLGCGVSLSLVFPPNSNQPPFDVTPGLRDFSARLIPVTAGAWNLKIEANFLDLRQLPTPCYLPMLGGASSTIVQIGNDTGETLPRKLEVAGDSQSR